MSDQQRFDFAIAQHQAGRSAEAEAIYRELLLRYPQNPDLLHLLGVATHQRGDCTTARAWMEQAIRLNPRRADYFSNFGRVLHDLGEWDQAVVAFESAIHLDPVSAEACLNLGNTRRCQGQTEAAIAAYREAVRLRADYPLAYLNLGAALDEAGQIEEAIAISRAGLARFPKDAGVWNNLGNSLKHQGDLDASIAAYEAASGCDPSDAVCLNNLGNAYRDQARVDEAIAYFRRSLALDPQRPHVHSNLIYTAYFHPDYDALAIEQEHREWSRRYAAPLRDELRPHGNDRSPERRLRIGYVSPDFWAQAESYFVVPLLAHHDHEQFEIHAYASVAQPDATTERLRGSVDRWHDVRWLSDAALAEKIRADGIDVLIDLTMHMAGHRLLAFARKPAPVQVTWLAYPGSTGLDTIDYRLTDTFMDPPGGRGPTRAKSRCGCRIAGAATILFAKH